MAYRRPRKTKFQYSIPMHRVQQLPAIQEEFDDDLDYEIEPYQSGYDEDFFLPNISHLPPLPPVVYEKRNRSPLATDHMSLHFLISDYLNYARGIRQVSGHYADTTEVRTCWCCDDRNSENILRQGLRDRYSEAYRPQYNIGDVLGTTDRIKVSYITDPSEKWAPQRRVRYRYRPRIYVLPEIKQDGNGEDLESYITRVSGYDYQSPSISEADKSYRTSMRRLFEKVYALPRI